MTKKNKQVNSTPRVIRLITYSAVFSNAKAEEIAFYLKDVPTNSALEFVSYLNLLETSRSIGQENFNLFAPLLFKFDKDFQKRLVDYLQRINIQEYLFIDVFSLLRVTESLLSNNNNEYKELTKLDYSNIFKAYLICCEEKALPNSIMENYNTNIEDFLKIYLPYQMIQNDLDYPIAYADLEIVKFHCFIDFCSQNIQFNQFLKIYWREYKLSDWNDYISPLFHLYLKMLLNEDNKTNKIVVDSSYEYLNNLLTMMSVDIDRFTVFTDFRSLREKPIYKLDTETYIILYFKFFIDKFFQSFLFDLARVLSIHKEETGISGYPQLKQLLGQHFAENRLLGISV